MEKGSQLPKGVRMRPFNPARIKRSGLSTARTDGPQRGQVCVSVIRRHTRATDASRRVPKATVGFIRLSPPGGSQTS